MQEIDSGIEGWRCRFGNGLRIFQLDFGSCVNRQVDGD